jgi:hypothetical protein
MLKGMANTCANQAWITRHDVTTPSVVCAPCVCSFTPPPHSSGSWSCTTLSTCLCCTRSRTPTWAWRRRCISTTVWRVRCVRVSRGALLWMPDSTHATVFPGYSCSLGPLVCCFFFLPSVVSCMCGAKGLVSCGGFSHVGFPSSHFARLVFDHHSPLSLSLSRHDVPASTVILDFVLVFARVHSRPRPLGPLLAQDPAPDGQA